MADQKQRNILKQGVQAWNQWREKHPDIMRPDLGSATLGSANLERAIVGYTSFGDVDLSMVKNLETVQHRGPSSIGIDTIYRSGGTIPEVFLKGAGVPDSFLEYMHSLIGKPIDYYSCFISYSSQGVRPLDVFAHVEPDKAYREPEKVDDAHLVTAEQRCSRAHRA